LDLVNFGIPREFHPGLSWVYAEPLTTLTQVAMTQTLLCAQPIV
jgi:hypothetical protein